MHLWFSHLILSWRFSRLGSPKDNPSLDPTLRQIDRPKPPEDVVAMVHPNIVELIFKFALTPQDGSFIEPRTVTSNWKTKYRRSVNWYRTRSGYTDCCSWVDSGFVWASASDKWGPYKVVRQSLPSHHRCVLLAFLQADLQYRPELASPPTLVRNGKRWDVINPGPYYPDADSPNYNAAIALGVEQVNNQVSFKDLVGWVYYDHFLRFLHTIGLPNAARIKTLRFGGACKIHTCSWNICREGSSKNCDEGLVQALRCYITFIKKFCIGL
ncbi:hypothetical protein BKA65DRAFT_483247 [Rhexocercosporidium sp. MPI-PUGE-AT-0058]|nr:hypothetical protein BKA65DRAFT_483247 [Rhexocercosporidium sp. MPI-PUGE-AT-0058]